MASITLAGALAEEKPAAGISQTAAKAEPEDFTIYRIYDRVPVHLVDAFGVMLINTREENPSPQFIIAIRQSRTLISTSDAKMAAQALKLIPKGSKVRWYDSCTVPRSYGLPASVRDRFEASIKAAGLVLLDDYKLTCYCEK